jgi:hypothetical protein
MPQIIRMLDINIGFLKNVKDVFLSMVSQRECTNNRPAVNIKSCGSPPIIEKEINKIVKK